MPVRGAGGSRERIALTVVEIHRSPGRAAGLCAARVLRTLLRRGPVVSVAPGEILDRRLSTDWIPWTAARGIATVQIRRRRMIAFEVDPRIAASLPWAKRARRVARLNRVRRRPPIPDRVRRPARRLPVPVRRGRARLVRVSRVPVRLLTPDEGAPSRR